MPRSSRRSILACLLLAVTAALALASPALADPQPGQARYDAVVRADHPLAYWKLDDSSTTTAADSSGNNFPMTGAGAMTAGAAGPMAGSRAFRFDGGTLSRGYSNTTDNFAVELWARSDRAGEREAVFSNGRVNPTSGCWEGFIMAADSGNASAFDAGPCQRAFATWGPAWSSTTDWHYIVARRAGGVTSLYVDGNLIGTDPNPIVLTGGTVRIGGYEDSRKSNGLGTASESFGPFKGAVSDVAFYGAQNLLPVADIGAHYNAAFGAPTNTTAPSIAMSRIIGPGKTLRAKPGSWVGAGITYDYQWLSCDGDGGGCTPIAGATGSTYTLTDDTAGGTIRVRVTASDTEGAGSPATSAIAAQAADDQTLYSEAVMDASPLAYWKLDDATTTTAADSSGNNFPMAGSGAMTAGVAGPMEGSRAFRFSGGTLSRDYSNYTDNFAVEMWVRSDRVGEREGVFSNGTANARTGCWEGFIVAADTGNASVFDAGPCNQAFATWGPAWSSSTDWHYLVATRAGGVTSLYVDGNLIGTDNHSILLNGGTVRIGGYQDPRKSNGLGTASESFGPFKGAIADVAWYGHPLTTAQIGAHYDAGHGVPANGARPTITPATTPHVGDTLTAHNGTWAGDAPLAYAYQWQSCDTGTCTAIKGATQSTYTPVSADVGKTIDVVVTVSNGLGATSATSAQTVPVRIAIPQNTEAPAVTGDAVDYGTLTSTTGTWTSAGPVVYARQWRRCDASGDGCSDIGGATGETYRLTRFDIGYTVRVAVTATNDGGSATATSAAGALVRAAPPVSDTLPVIDGAPGLGATLTASAGTWTGTVPMTYTYQWRRCDGAGSACVDIDGATSDSYIMTAADDQHALRVAVTATNAGGAAAATSTATAAADAIAPVLTLAGDLPFWNGSQLPIAGGYTLDYGATDTGGSGVVRLQATVDGVTVDDTTQACPAGGCLMGSGFWIDTADYADGVHTARVTATDAAGNRTTHTVTWRNPAAAEAGVTAPAASPSVFLSDAV
jgi:hypothetical protein